MRVHLGEASFYSYANSNLQSASGLVINLPSLIEGGRQWESGQIGSVADVIPKLTVIYP